MHTNLYIHTYAAQCHKILEETMFKKGISMLGSRESLKTDMEFIKIKNKNVQLPRYVIYIQNNIYYIYPIH